MNLAIKLVSIGTITLIAMTAFMWFGWPAAAFMALCAGAGFSLISALRFVQKYLEERKVDRVLFEDSLKTRIETLPQTEDSSEELAEDYAREMINRHR